MKFASTCSLPCHLALAGCNCRSQAECDGIHLDPGGRLNNRHGTSNTAPLTKARLGARTRHLQPRFARLPQKGTACRKICLAITQEQGSGLPPASSPHTHTTTRGFFLWRVDQRHVRQTISVRSGSKLTAHGGEEGFNVDQDGPMRTLFALNVHRNDQQPRLNVAATTTAEYTSLLKAARARGRAFRSCQ